MFSWTKKITVDRSYHPNRIFSVFLKTRPEHQQFVVFGQIRKRRQQVIFIFISINIGSPKIIFAPKIVAGGEAITQIFLMYKILTFICPKMGIAIGMQEIAFILPIHQDKRIPDP